MTTKRSVIVAFATGAPIGCLGGLIGLGGAEFRLPVLVGIFNYRARKAVALNIVISLVTVAFSMLFRAKGMDWEKLVSLVPIILSIVCGSMTGAWFGASLTHRISESVLRKAILFLLVGIGILLLMEGFTPLVSAGFAFPNTVILVFTGFLCGIGIGFISSLLGVAGGEIIIPTLLLVFGIDIKLAGTISLLISFPTILVGVFRHARKGMYAEKSDFVSLVLPMGIASILGAFIGAALVAVVPGQFLKLLLGLLLVFSALKIFLESKP